jgi:PhoPQ-activated pathogenicity-related protein
MFHDCFYLCVRACLPALCVLLGGAPGRALATALDDYVAAPDANYTYSLARTITGSGYTGYVLDMKSQVWRSTAEVDRVLWQHWLTIIKPTTVSSDKALLFINGGSNGGSAPTTVDSTLRTIATATNSIVVDLKMIPNQPLKFADESDPRYITSGRTEDELIAYTWDKFLRTGDGNWPARLPMTKAAVRAMDTVQAYVPTLPGGYHINGFVVSGASKRGWTTWTTAAVDSRVIAIIPIVIDILNVVESMTHHYAAYGFWAPAIQDYVDMNIMGWFGTPELDALMVIEDPYGYRSRYTMPKFMINASGDQFFLPDSSQFYFADLPGEKYLRYVPNSDHSMSGTDAADSLQAYYRAILTGTARPQFSWTIQQDGSIRLQTVTAPTSVKLWKATNPTARDFRKDIIGSAYTSTTLTDQGGGVYIGQVPVPPAGWTAFFIEMTYPSGGTVPFKFTTEVNVLPKGSTLNVDVRNGMFGRIVEFDPNWPRLYRPDAAVTLTAEPSSGKGFAYWEVWDPCHPDDANYVTDDTNNPITLGMTTDRRVTAAFKCSSGLPLGAAVLMVAMLLGLKLARRRN